MSLFSPWRVIRVPPNRPLAVLPSSIYVGWTDESVDHFIADAMRTSATTLVEAGIQDGQNVTGAAPYVNYALFGTPVERMYGESLERLLRSEGGTSIELLG